MGVKRLGRVALTLTEWIGVIVFALVLVGVAVGGAVLAWVGDPPSPMGQSGSAPATAAAEGSPVMAARAPIAISEEERGSLFEPIHAVLTHPRCMNCHPDGDRPLSDRDGVHPMNISRASFESGLKCSTCHAEHNTELAGGVAGPPGAPHWQLPPAETPMAFQNRTVTELCTQLRDVARNGERSLEALHHHVSNDPLVLWGWKPGGTRAVPPVSHAAFTESFKRWVEADGICPGEQVSPLAAPPEGESEGETAGATKQAPA